MLLFYIEYTAYRPCLQHCFYTSNNGARPLCVQLVSEDILLNVVQCWKSQWIFMSRAPNDTFIKKPECRMFPARTTFLSRDNNFCQHSYLRWVSEFISTPIHSRWFGRLKKKINQLVKHGVLQSLCKFLCFFPQNDENYVNISLFYTRMHGEWLRYEKSTSQYSLKFFS